MFCPQCGAPNEDDAIFCGNCGAVLNVDESAAPPAELPPLPEGAQPVEVVGPDQPPPPPQPPSPPPPRPAAPAAPPTSGMAIASLLLGIGGLTVVPVIGSVLALILGYMARKDIRERPAEVSGEGLATAGIVMGWIAIGLMVLGLLAGVGFMACGACGALGSGSY